MENEIKQIKVHHSSSENEEYYFHEGCHILELLNDNEHEDLSIARARVEPNKETQLHALRKTIERYIIQQGEGLATINGEEYYVEKNDVLIIEKDQSQKIRNTGIEDLIFLVICSPRFEETNYQTLD